MTRGRHPAPLNDNLLSQHQPQGPHNSQIFRGMEGYSQNPKPIQNLGRQFEKMKNKKKENLFRIKKSLENQLKHLVQQQSKPD